MRTFNINVLAVLSCIAIIGATPIRNCSPQSPDTTLPEVNPQLVAYVPLQQLMEVLT